LKLILGSVSADQPVNCLRQNFHENIWNFYVSQDTQKVDLFKTRELCTHNIPNKVQIMNE
jgi:hypothetical protein